jgi:glycosyltransferase involved in cell wall biosynthesis
MNVLLLATYPAEPALHGGQLRLRALQKAYIAAGCQVQVAGVLGGGHYSRASNFCPYPGLDAFESLIDNSFLMEDWCLGELFANSKPHYESLKARISFLPDVIHVEQPWLFKFAERYLADIGSKATLIYGSQNIEYQLKGSILGNYFDQNHVARCVELIRKAETYALQRSDLCCCVSREDIAHSQALVARNYILAANGVEAWNASLADIEAANRFSSHAPFALFCASAHPPNVKGFEDMLSGGFGALAPNERIVLAGSATESIMNSPAVSQSLSLRRKLIPAGILPRSTLEGLLTTARAIVLPITQGGGTNLKTAEALWADKPIVATRVAMRGFEPFLDSSGVVVGDDAAAFKQGLRRVMSGELVPNHSDRRDTVLWESCLAEIVASATLRNACSE